VVELASISDPDLVPGAVASVPGVREAPDRSPTEALVERLEGRKTLLIQEALLLLGGLLVGQGRNAEAAEAYRGPSPTIAF